MKACVFTTDISVWIYNCLLRAVCILCLPGCMHSESFGVLRFTRASTSFPNNLRSRRHVMCRHNEAASHAPPLKYAFGLSRLMNKSSGDIWNIQVTQSNTDFLNSCCSSVNRKVNSNTGEPCSNGYSYVLPPLRSASKWISVVAGDRWKTAVNCV